MLEAGRVKPGDVVYDLGSGDGRVVITAAQHFGVRAVGVELMPDLVRKARERILSLGLADRVSIVEGSALRVDLSPADVVTMWFLTNSNDRLRPIWKSSSKSAPAWSPMNSPFEAGSPRRWFSVKSASMEHTIYVYEIGRTR